MSFVKLNNGVNIPAVGFGVWQTPANDAETVVYTALKAGYRHVDSAHNYHNEAQVCRGIAKFIKDTGAKREDFFYTTKIRDEEHGYEEAKESLKQRLEYAAPIGYIDLVLVHTPKTSDEKRHGTWLALQEAVDAGTVKSIGVSNYGIKHLEQVLAYPELKYKPAVNQIELHPWFPRPELVNYCESKGIKLEAYSPLVLGKKFGDPLLVSLSKKYNVGEAQILIKWSLQKGFIALPKSVTPSRIVSNFQLDFELSKEDFDTLSEKSNEGYVPGWTPADYPLDSEK